jgi:FG-GAP-like repeat/Bacterial Ig-like domain (group 3)/Chitobiase/beta-hexosaminidase C-terminal domain
MFHNFQLSRLLNFDLSPYPFKALARRRFRFVALCGALAATLWVPWNLATAQTRASTAITLAITAAGSPVTTITSGTVVTLTAEVTVGSTNVSAGQVNFCDATAAYCTDVHILATAQLTSSGKATYKFRPGIGSHSYKSVFVGTSSYAGSISNSSSLTVTGTAGPFATAASIAETGAWGNYTLTGTVTEAGGTVAPVGIVSFLDASHGNSVLAIGTLGSAAVGVGWPNPGSLTNTQGTSFVLVADLNGDGIPDLVLGSNPVLIYLGNVDGTYTKGTTISVQQAPTSYPIVVADFNGDGIPDLAIALYGSNDIAIMPGKGDGTFAQAILASVPGTNVDINQIVAGDFNSDGIPDLAVIASADNSAVDILLGNGDGTFTAETTNPPISRTPLNLATGDFNGDGKTDLVVTEYGGTIAILLGNGDGTFAASGSVNSASSGSPSPIAVADFNGDGNLDIAVVAGVSTGESVIVLTGNGDGTFNSPFSSPGTTSTSVTWVQVADFNQDGTADVVLADSSGSATVFLNNGSGSLSESFPVVSGLSVPYYLEVGVGDLNGDGYPDIVAGGYYSNALGLYLTEPTETASASASVQVSGVGRHLAEASFLAEGSYESSVSSSIPLWGLLPVTSTTLRVTSGGSTVTTVTPGTTVLLTSRVNVGTAPVTAGQVNFCDASAPHCTDIHILGSAALSSSGTATFTFVPGPGAHSYQAQFVEDGFGLASASNVASLNVGPAPSPVYSDTAAITWNGSPGDYSLTATMTGYGGPASPTGTVSFLDTSFANTSLATAALGPGTAGIGWLISQTPAASGDPVSEVAGDFNGDGIPDLALLWNSTSGAPSVTILFGKGDGTFTTGPTVQPAGVQGFPTMIGGDFNGDGKADLAVLSYAEAQTTSYITVLLGIGDGTFAAPHTGQVYNQPVTGGDVIIGTLAAADFNGDGKLDVAVVGDYVSSGGVTILLGNGDGTFTVAGPNLDPSGDFALIATGDFNGDGIPDFVTPNYFEFGGSPTIFLGKGDGTFTFKTASLTLEYFPTSVAVGDFNGDGILDLAFSDLNGVEIALGNGDGTFNETSASPIAVPSELYSLQVGDFNHDGKLDLAGLDTYFDQIVLLLGAGDGTFVVTTTTPSVNASFDSPHQIAVADFNGDGVPDLAMLTAGVNTASILLTEPTETAAATVNGIAPIGAGMHNVDASYAGDSDYSALTSATIPLTAGLAPIVFTPSAGTYSTPQTITLSESIPGSTIYYSASGIVSTNGFVPYTSPIPLTESGVATIQAYAIEAGYQQSYNVLENFTISLPVLLISSLSPAIKPAGSSAFALTVNGLGFTASSTVNWGSTVLSTQYVSGTELTAQVQASAIANSGTATVTVQSPMAGPGSSNALMFEIDSAGSNTAPNFATSSATVSHGSSATYPVTLPSSATDVSATCLNLPIGATCSYSAATGAVTINTSSTTPAGTYQIIVVFTETLPGLATAIVFLPILLLPRLLGRRKWAARGYWRTACLALLASAIAIASGCGGGGGGNTPPPSPQTHLVTSSGVVTLTVQ